MFDHKGRYRQLHCFNYRFTCSIWCLVEIWVVWVAIHYYLVIFVIKSSHIYWYFLLWSFWYLVVDKRLLQLCISVGHGQVTILYYSFNIFIPGQKTDTQSRLLHFSWPWWPACIFSWMFIRNCARTTMRSPIDIKLWKDIRPVRWLKYGCVSFLHCFIVSGQPCIIKFVSICIVESDAVRFGGGGWGGCIFCLWSLHTLSLLLHVILILTIFHHSFPFFFFWYRNSRQRVCCMHRFPCSWRAGPFVAPSVEFFRAVMGSCLALF